MNPDVATTNPPFHQWESKRKERLRITSIGVILEDIDQTDEWGQKLYQVLDCYHTHLWKQHSKIPTHPSDREKMIAAVHELDLCFHSLMEEPEAEGWYFGISTADNLAYGLGNLLIQVRNELLLAIAIRH